MMMSREEVHIRQHRDRLLALAESNAAAAHKPNNQKRRATSVNKSPLRFGVGGKSQSGPKLSIQDFVRADPGYTPNIEHLVFPDRRKASPVKAASHDSGKTRSRLAEMFALSRHLQQRSQDRDKRDTGSRKQLVNRSVDSISTPIPSTTTSHSALSSGVPISTGLPTIPARDSRPEPRRWATTEEPLPKPPQRVSPNAEPVDKRGSNVSILHLRSTSEPWETSPTSIYPPSTRSYTAVVHSTSASASSSSSGPVLTKHQSLGATSSSQQKKSEFISSSQVSSGELFSCSRELSPVRWCDREVDGVYLGRSGWVQVQQRSLDENRRNNYGSSLTASSSASTTTSSLPQSRRPNIKLADYHSASEPGIKRTEQTRPAYLPLLKRDVEFVNTTPSPPPPPPNIPESFSPPPITPIISPPPAFQDRVTKTPKSRPLYGKPPFLPRSNAIDTDIISPPSSPPHTLNLNPPPINWGTLPEPRTTPSAVVRRPKLTPSPVKSMPLPSQITSPYNRIPQAKSLEEAGTNRRSQFLQRYKDSSSSSSSSLGFRSLDSCVSRPAMPRLSEHTDSLDMYEDADEEDNNSSSLNLSNVSSVLLNSSPDSILDRMNMERKTSPSGRSRFVHHRSQRRSPQEPNKQLTCSSPSSSSSGELTIGNTSFPARSPSGNQTPFRRSAPTRQYTAQRPTTTLQDEHKVRRSRSLQLPEKRSPGSIAQYREHVPPQPKLSPQQNAPEPHRFVVKVNNETRPRRHPMSQPQSLNDDLDEEMLREAEVVTEFLYGSRSRAAAKALLLQRYHERQEAQVIKEPPKPVTNNGFNFYFVGNKRPQKPLQRGATTPNLTPAHQTYQTSPTTEVKSTCSSSTCDFWPHCGQREPMYPPTNTMKPSQSYPTHQRPPEPIRNVTPEPKKRQNGRESRLSPDGRFRKPERRLSPMSRSPSGGAGNSSCSSSSSDIWLTTSDRTITRSPRDASTPLDDAPPLPTTLAPTTSTIPIPKEREMILTRPGSAPADVEEKVVVTVKNTELANSQQRSMSLPKSFLSGNGVGTSRHRWYGRYGTDFSPAENPFFQQDVLSTDGSVSVIFMSFTLMTYVQQQTEIVLHMDATFKVVPRAGGAFQLFTLHLLHDDKTFPLLYALMERKTAAAYKAVFQFFQQQLDGTRVTRLMADYETAMRSAAVATFQGVQLRGCWFHYAKAVYRKAKELGLLRGANRDNMRLIIKAAMALPLLPRESLNAGLQIINDLAIEQNMEIGNFKSYLERYWLPLQISVHGEYHRTNNAVEAFHRDLYSGQFPCKRQPQEAGPHGLSPSPRHRPPTPEVAHTAPVTPSHDPALDRRRSPGLTKAARRTKASSTPHLLEQPDWETSRKWTDKNSGSVDTSIQKEMGSATILSGHPRLQPSESTGGQSHKNMSESVLQKFRKTFSLRFQKKGSKESCSSDYGDGFVDQSEEDSPLHIPTQPPEAVKDHDQSTEQQKYRFGPLVWRSSKERKKNSKATRSLKCNSGDSGIQIEMVSGYCVGGDSSESHDTDQLGDGDGDDTDSPQPVRRRRQRDKASRPHSDHLINHILIEKFKADLQSRSHRHHHVRRTHSDLGGQRLLQWDRGAYQRSMTSPLRGRPRRTPPDAPGGVTLRGPRRPCRPQLRRSLSQPVDIDKLSPLMRNKTSGLRLPGNVFSEDEHERLGTSDDEMMSDSESSVASLSERKKSLELAMDEDMVILAEAVFDHVAIEAEELAFRAGDVIEVLETVNRDWWWGSTDGRKGWFPAAFVRLRVSQEDTVEDCLAAMASGRPASKQLRRRTSISLLSNEQVRTSVVRELVHTERDFVKVLTDVVEGYLAECRRRKDMFTPEQIQTIFINLEDMLKFQAAFLKDLELCIDWESPHKSCVGTCFLTHRAGFRMYSDYCNHHPMATATLQELYQFNNYSKFFEACRLMRGLIEIPLDGYLLTPVQRICKYPLQLAELLKYTKPDHEDYEQIKEALEAMRDVAVLINERKRRMESLEKLSAWQQRVEGWEGGDLIDVSSQLIFQGEVIRVTSGMWTNNITLFVFDHQIIYCKKDILKRNTYVYKGRICLDTSEIIDIPDGKDPQLGVNVRHGIKVYSCVRDKYLLFCCRSSSEKQRWMDAFAQERKLVAQDRDEGLEFPQAARKLAKIAARCQRRPPSKPRSGKNYKRDSAYMGSSLQINSHSSNSLGRKMGTWFTFGSNKKTRHHDQTS